MRRAKGREEDEREGDGLTLDAMVSYDATTSGEIHRDRRRREGKSTTLIEGRDAVRCGWTEGRWARRPMVRGMGGRHGSMW